MKIKKLLFVTICFSLFNLQVFAGGSNDDITYSTEYDTNYTYGDVTDCHTVNGISNSKGVKKVGGIKVCVYLGSTRDATNTVNGCEDTTMSKFYISKINGSDGNEYTGWGCRKPKNGEVERIKKTIYVAEEIQVADSALYNCSITKGETYGSLDSMNKCFFSAEKAGVVEIVVESKYTDTFNTKTYYEYTILPRNSKKDDLDQNYYYGSVKSCPPSLSKRKFDDLYFCGTSVYNSAFSDEVFATCEDDTYETFRLYFDSIEGNDTVGHYQGFGCRKARSATSIEYVKRSIYVNQEFQIADQTRYDCKIISGPGELDSSNSCYFVSSTAGTTTVEVNLKYSSTKKYYEITINNSISHSDDLNDKYVYGNVSTCRIDGGGDLILFNNNYKFCGSRKAGFSYDYAYTQITCEKEDFDAFKLGFTVNNILYKGYACRKIKDEKDLEYSKRTLKVTEREYVQLSSKCKLISGDASLNEDNCDLYATKAGVIKIKAIKKNSNEASYYEYTITGEASASASGDSSKPAPLTGAVTCSTLFGPEKGTIRTMISNILKFIKYGGPILMLLLTIVDLVKTATSGEEGDFKKVFQNFLKRFIAAALLFFIDLIIQLLFMIVGLESTCFFD